MKKIFTTLVVIAIIFSCKKKDHAAPPPIAPTVTTTAVTNITVNSATGGGSIVSDGGATVTKSGIVWSKTNNTPTLKDSIVAGTVAMGPFTLNITGLDFNNTYYVRAFAINSADTAFGNVVSFSTANDTNKVRFTYNGQEVVYGIIISPTTGKKWLDRNLGAIRAATAFNDYQAYGDFFQWGRPADGHQLINWTSSTAGTAVNGMTSVLATSDNPGHNNFIAVGTASGPSNGDWRDDNNNNRWITTTQGPCPAGWHVPVLSEWRAEISNTQTFGTATSGGMTSPATAYSMLKLTSAGFRAGIGSSSPAAGQVWRPGERGYYCCTFSYAGNSYGLVFGDGGSGPYVDMNSDVRSMGYSVRCIKD